MAHCQLKSNGVIALKTTGTRLRLRRWGLAPAAAAAVLFAAGMGWSGSVAAADRELPAGDVAVAEQASAPTVTPSKTVVNPAGDTITVTGTGFLPELATGTRPPLAGQPAGAYIAFGAFATEWKPSTGAPSSSRPTMTSVDGGLLWAVPEAARSIVGQADSVTLNPDGSFTATLKVKRDFAGALPNGNYGIYTYPGSGGVQPLYETFTPVTFTGAAPTATSSAVPATTATAAPQPPTTGTSQGSIDTGSPVRTLLLGAGVVLVFVAAASAVRIRR